MTKELGLSREQILEMEIARLRNDLQEVKELLSEIPKDLDEAVTKLIRVVATGELSVGNIQKIAEVMGILGDMRERVLSYLNYLK